MDALPIKEQTGLPYASQVTTKDDTGNTVGVMHACGHDIHMTSWIGAATLLAGQRDRWSGTLVFVAQPAEEVVRGAAAMLADGMLTRFPKPDFALAMHDISSFPAGQVALLAGPIWAAVNMVEITVYGKGGHGARPHLTVDPVVLTSRIVLSLQTLVARETNPLDPAVVTVGSIHGGTKANIIPDEVKLQLTVRSYSPEVQKQLLAGIERIAKAEAAGARAPKEPLVYVIPNESSAVVVNDPALTDRIAGALRRGLGEASVVPGERTMGGEDFGAFGNAAKAPSLMMLIGTAEPTAWAQAKANGTTIPNVHSALFAPDRERTLRTGVSALTLATLELLRKPVSAR
jgi:amidohydrolase